VPNSTIKRIINRKYYIFARILGGLFIAVLLLYLASFSPKLQNKVISKVTETLNEKINGSVSVGDIKLVPFTTLILKDVVILDSNPSIENADTLARIDHLTANFTLWSLLSDHGAGLSRVNLDGGWLNMVSELQTAYKSNLARVLNLLPKGLPEQAPEIFRIKTVKIRNFRYSLRNPDLPAKDGGIDFGDLDLVCNIDVSDMRFADCIMYGTVNHLDLIEKTGYCLENGSGKAVVGRGQTLVSDLVLQDQWSDINLSLFKMTYKNSKVFKDFLEEVRIEADFDKSIIGMPTINCFAGAFPSNNQCYDITKGHFEGPICDFSLDGFSFTETNSSLSASVNCRIAGLPEISSTIINVRNSRIWANARSLEDFIGVWTGQSINFKTSSDRLNINCNTNGTLDDFDVKAQITSAVGAIALEGKLENVLNTELPIIIDAHAKTTALNIGKLLFQDQIGLCDMEFSGNAKLLPEQISVDVDSLCVDRIGFRGYEYKGLYAKGGYGKRGPYGTLLINDPNVKLLAKGEAGHYSLDMPLLDLKAINLDNRDQVSKASLTANIIVKDQDYDLSISKLILANSSGRHDIGRMTVKVSDNKTAELESNFANASVSVESGLGDLVKNLEYSTARKELWALFNDAPENRIVTDSKVSVSLFDTRELLAWVLPDLYIANRSTVDLQTVQGKLSAKVNSQRIAIKDKYLKDVALNLGNDNNELSAKLKASELFVGNSLHFSDLNLAAVADDNDYGIELNLCNNFKKDRENHIVIKGALERLDDALSISASPDNSTFWFGDDLWTVSSNGIVKEGNRIKLDNLELSSSDQFLGINGGINPQGQDTIRLVLNNFELGAINKLDIRGQMNGKAVLISPTKEKLRLMASFASDALLIAGENAGSIRLGSSWEEQENKLRVIVQNYNDSARFLYAMGSYSPKDRMLRASLNLDDLKLSNAQPFLKNIFEKLGGSLSGKIVCQGPIDELNISGENTRLNNVVITPLATGVEYTLDGPFRISSKGIIFDKLEIKDKYKGSATLDGSLNNFLKTPKLNAQLSMNGLKVVDKKESSSFYGNLNTSGNIMLQGPFSDLLISGDISTVGNGDIHVPLGGNSLTQNSRELLSFRTVKTDPFEDIKTVKKERASLNIKAGVHISPEVKLSVELDKSSGNVASLQGEGNIETDINLGENDIRLNGNYIVSSGNYSFVIPGLITKDFELVDGSSINFGGDIMDSQLNLKANYSLKTSLAPISANSNSVSTRRLVNCILSISDKISNPVVGFDIDIPNLDPVTKASVQTALNTEDKIQKQFVSLLVLNNFLPSESSGVVNNSNMVYSNMANMLSGQVNSIFQKLDIPLDLGFGYQPNEEGTDIFDVAVSTQLFNNRVIVGGSVGNRKYSTTTSANGDIVGDIDIEVKIDREGRFRFKLFSHSADEYTSFLDYSQRNGAGFTYQKEYTNFNELFYNKAKRDTLTIQRLERNKNLKTISIDE